MITNRFSQLGALTVLLVLAQPGCVERKEKIKIAPDGSVTINLTYKGPEDEVTSGDAMPSVESGWDVERHAQKKDDGVEVELRSERRFEPGEVLPRTFAAPGDPNTDLYCDFPTEVRIERRYDAIYYYFHRTYTPRRWAYIQYWQDEFIDNEIKQLGEKPVNELTPEEQAKIAQAFAGVEAFKQIEFSTLAIAESHPDLPVEVGLMARRALIDYYQTAADNGDLERVIGICSAMADEKLRGACFDKEADRILGEAYDAYLNSLRVDSGLRKRDIEAFEQAYHRAERYYKISEQLGGHSFDISVTMPGRIIANNALEGDVGVDEENHTSTVNFTFDGKRFRDRPHELIAVSRLEYNVAKELERRNDDDDR